MPIYKTTKMIDTLNINFKLMSQSEIRNHYDIRQFHNRDIRFKDKTTEEKVHLNTLLEEYFRENYNGTPKQKSSDKNKLKNKVVTIFPETGRMVIYTEVGV